MDKLLVGAFVISIGVAGFGGGDEPSPPVLSNTSQKQQQAQSDLAKKSLINLYADEEEEALEAAAEAEVAGEP